MPARGLCKVSAITPTTRWTLARMTREEIRAVVDGWTGEFEELSGLDWIEYVQIFENRGAMMGASNPIRTDRSGPPVFCPTSPAAETKAQCEHLALTGSCLLCEYLARGEDR